MEEHRAGGRRGPLSNAVLIAGPTASGKSAAAIAIARRTGGVIINADSMQVYDGLRILTARPDDAALAAAPHRLYGHVPPSVAYSVGAWLRDVADLLERDETARRQPIFVGGTGLYFRALTGGLSQMPPVPPAIRERWRILLAEEGAVSLHAKLAVRDPTMAAALAPADGQRIVRALEMIEATGKSIGAWRAGGGKALIDAATARKIVIAPERALLHRNIERRFDEMIGQGAVEEVRALAVLDLDPTLPVMKAIGVAQLIAHLDGRTSLPDAIERAKAATRQYAKRQMTWFRNQFERSWRFVQTPREAEELD